MMHWAQLVRGDLEVILTFLYSFLIRQDILDKTGLKMQNIFLTALLTELNSIWPKM